MNIYLDKKRHYFPDFRIDDDIIIECKGYCNAQNNAKIKAGIKYFENFEIINKNDYRISFVPRKKINEWYEQMKEKYGNLLIINHNPHERSDNGNNKS